MKPYMGANEIKMIEGYLKPEMHVLEWGSGWSTLHFGRMVKWWISIEHDPDWVLKVIDAAPASWFCNDPTGSSDRGTITIEGRDFDDDYVQYIEAGRNAVEAWSNVGAVLIDGRERVRCARAILPHITPDTIIFFHDFLQPTRTYYLDVLRDYELIDHCAWFPGCGGSLGVLRKRA